MSDAPAAESNRDLAVEVQRLAEKLHHRERHLESLRDQRNDLHRQLREEKKVAEARIKELETALAKAQSGMPPATVSATNGESTQELQAEIERLAEKLNVRERHLESLRDQRNDLQEQLQEAKEAADARVKELQAQLSQGQTGGEATLSAQVEEQRREIQRLQQASQAAEKRAQALEAELRETRAAASKEGEGNDAIRQLQEEKAEREARIRALEAELAHPLAAEQATGTAFSEQHTQEVLRLRQDKEAAEGRSKELEDDLVQTRADLNSARTEIDRKEQQVQTLRTELEDAKKPMQGLQGKVDVLTRQLGVMGEELDRSRSFAEEAVKARREGEKAASRLQDVEAAFKKAAERSNQLEAELATQQGLVEALQREKSETQAQLAASRTPTGPETNEPSTIEDIIPVEETLAASTGSVVDVTSDWDKATYAEKLAAAGPIPQGPPVKAFRAEEESTVEASPHGEAGAPPSAPEEDAQPPVREKKKLLVAEDDPSIRRIIEITLQKAGLDVVTAKDGEEALRKAVDEKPDAILLDMMMPKMSGIELCEKLRASRVTAGTPVGFLTAQRDVAAYKKALELGSTLYMTKPFRPDHLITFVSVLLRGRKPRIRRRTTDS